MKQTTKEAINKRFFETLDILKERRMIYSFAAFCRATGYDPSNLSRLRKHPTCELPLPLLAHLVERHGVSADRILTGKGNRFRTDFHSH